MDFRDLDASCRSLSDVNSLVMLFESSVRDYSREGDIELFKSFVTIFKSFMRCVQPQVKGAFLEAISPHLLAVYESEIALFLARVSKMVALLENPDRSKTDCIQIFGNPNLSKGFLEIKLENLDSTHQGLSSGEVVSFLPRKIIAKLTNDYSVLRKQYVSAMSKFK